MKHSFFILCTAMLLLCNPIFLTAADVWDVTSKESWTNGTGTESDPYRIETAAQLAYLSEQVKNGSAYDGIFFLQTEDIDINSKSWISIGYNISNTFSGFYDGGQKQVLNLSNFLFGCVKSATFQNITIAGTSRYSLIKSAYGDVRLNNCHNKSTSEITYAGAGLVVRAELGCITLDHCSNHATVTGSYKSSDTLYIGGLVGRAQNIKMERCYNTGDISYKTPNSNYYGKLACAAGLVGFASSLDIANSFNNGKIYMSCTKYGDGAGGYTIVHAVGLATGKGIIKKSYNTGYIYAAPKEYIKGYAFGLSNCTNQYCYSIGYPRDPDGTKFSYYLGLDCSNCYCVLSADHKYAYDYIASSASVDIYYNSNFVVTNEYHATAKSTEQMKSPSFVSLLNGETDSFYPDYTNINNGYPIFRWQLNEQEIYNIQTIYSTAQGSVTGAGEYPNGAQIQLTAVPKEHYTFTQWSDGVTDNPRTVSVTGDATYMAQFERSSYTVYINQDCSITVE